jgi:glutamate decarboxylase
MPVVALRAAHGGPDLAEVSHLLREHGWIVPSYTLPADAQDVTVLRMVVKENFSRDMVDRLVTDVRGALRRLAGKPEPRPRKRDQPIC